MSGALTSPRADAGVEPFVTRFLNPQDLRTLSEFKDDGDDRSLSASLMDPIANLFVNLVPPNVAPNVLTISALVCVFHAFYYTHMYRHEWPVCTIVLSATMFVLYHLFDSVDGKHARRIRNESPLGYLLNNACDSVAVPFIVLTVCMQLGIDDSKKTWYLVQGAQLIFIWANLAALNLGRTSYGVFRGVGEAIFLMNTLLLVRAVFGLEWLALLFESLTSLLLPGLSFDAAAAKFIHRVYYFLVAAVSIRALTMKFIHSGTRYILLFALFYRAIPGMLLRWGVTESISMEVVITDGLFMSILSTDLVLCRMANRDLHYWIVFMAMLSLLDKFAIWACVVFYFASVFYDVASFMNLPMFTVVKNVYIDGVFDLCHLGHKNHILRALSYGNRLLVGVMADEDVRKYKRDPIMTTEERVREVEALRCVYKVIPSAPCFGMSEEFIERWNIHVVLCSPEYDKPEDKYYKVPRELGIVKVMPRTEGVSTSDIIKRIKKRLENNDI